MGLWQQLRACEISSGESEIPTVVADKSRSCGASTDQASDAAAGKALIAHTVHQIAELWNEVEASGGSLAWEWIVHGSRHGRLIRRAEDLMNAVGSKGNHNALDSACDAWLTAWRAGIQNWKRRSSTLD